MRRSLFFPLATVASMTVVLLAVAGQSAAQDVNLSSDAAGQARSAFVQSVSTTGGPAAPVASASVVQSSSINDSLQPFPHVEFYGGVNSSGWPLVGSTDKLGTCSNNPAVACTFNSDCGSPTIMCNNPGINPDDAAPLNQAQVDAYANHSLITLPPTPTTDSRLDILPAIRTRNSAVRIYSYVMASTTWCPQINGLNSYPIGSYYRDYWLASTGGDAHCNSQSNTLLWLQDGTLAGDAMGVNVNLAHRVDLGGGTYQYDVAENIAQTMYNHAKKSKGYDGMFIDVFCRGILWAEPSGNPIDYARAGYGNDNSNPANRTAFDQGWAAGHQRLAEHLRELAIADGQPDFAISGNCGQTVPALQPYINGWMRENYPYQNGGTFYSNMLTYPWGFLYQDTLMRAPQVNYVFTGSSPTTQPYSAFNQQKMRFGLGSASLGNGYHAFGDTSASVYAADVPSWWYDEYAVDTSGPQASPLYGQAKNGFSYIGWLGQPLADYYQMVYRQSNPSPDLLTTNQGFETAGALSSDLPGWAFTDYSPSVATVLRDTTTAAVGTASAKVHIDQGNDISTYAVNIHPTQSFSVSANQQYSVTFWAKASADRTVDVTIWNGGFIQTVYTAAVSTSWRQYQAVMKPTSSFTATVDLDLGRDLGDVWIDDVHVQAGVSSVYRRDFDHGIVLVNPSDSIQTVVLEKPYKKIAGTVNPSLNDGSVVSSVTLTPNVGQGVGDAIFLLNYDITPPAAVSDLRAP